MGLRVEGVSADTPASQTLMVLSLEPETMVLPSGEKATERTQSLCALCFSALSSKDAAASTGAVSFGLRVGGCQCRRTRIPDFERAGCATGDDRLPIWIELHGQDRVGIGVLDLGEFV